MLSCRYRVLLLIVMAMGLGLAAPKAARAAVSCSANPAGNSTCHIDPAIDPQALCNDGTQPVFWVRRGSGSGLYTWVIWLEGGGRCTDQTSCSERASAPGSKGLITSNGYVASSGVGILSTNPSVSPDLYNANVVEIHYCSSDTWTGAYSPSQGFNPNEPTTWYFQGRRIVLAAIKSLDELNLNFASARVILVGGSSAGGVGATLDINDIIPVLPHAPTQLLINDAGFALDIGQYDPNVPSPYVYDGMPNAFYNNYAAALSLWHGRGEVNCASISPTQQVQINCYSVSFVLQNSYIGIATFVGQSQLDTAQITDQLCPSQYGNCSVPPNTSTKQGVYAANYGKVMNATLIGNGTHSMFSVASPDTYEHVILDDPKLFTATYPIPGGSTSPSAVFHEWYQNPSGFRILSLADGPGVPP
jgi:hypothetical protein